MSVFPVALGQTLITSNYLLGLRDFGDRRTLSIVGTVITGQHGTWHIMDTQYEYNSTNTTGIVFGMLKISYKYYTRP